MKVLNIEVVQFQIGVDILGFPIYHQHIFLETEKEKNQTKIRGKNISKNEILQENEMYLAVNQVKQN